MSGQITDQNAGLGIGVVQPQSGLDYPFVSPGVGFNSEFTTDVRYLLADFYLSYDDKGYYRSDRPLVRNPLRIYWMYGFGTAPAWSFGQQPLPGIQPPTPVHATDLVVVDSNNRVVFDTTTADYFTETDWGDPKIIEGRESFHYKIYEWRKTTKPGETVCRAIKYASLHTNNEPVYERPIEFCPRQAILDERTIEKIPKRLLAMRVQNGECVTPWFKNKVTLVNGYNTGLTLGPTRTENLRRTTEIALKAIAGIGRGQFGLCSTTPCTEDEPTNVCPPGEDPEIEKCYDGQGEKIMTINGAVPDGNGNLSISASGCLWFRKPVHYTAQGSAHNYAKVLTPECCVSSNPLTPTFSDSGAPITNVLNVGADCPPCCDCDDYLKVAQYIKSTADRYKIIGGRAHDIKTLHEQNIARWDDQLSCRQKNALKLILVQQPCPCIDVVVSYCNQCDECRRGVSLNVSLAGAENASAVQLDQKYTEFFGGDEFQQPTLYGGWPAFSAYFPVVNARSSVSAKFRLCFCPQQPYQIVGNLTGTHDQGPILGGCEMTAPAAEATASVIVDCAAPTLETP